MKRTHLIRTHSTWSYMHVMFRSVEVITEAAGTGVCSTTSSPPSPLITVPQLLGQTSDIGSVSVTSECGLVFGLGCPLSLRTLSGHPFPLHASGTREASRICAHKISSSPLSSSSVSTPGLDNPRVSCSMDQHEAASPPRFCGGLISQQLQT